MNILIRQARIAATLAAIALATPGQASDGTITFTGAVTGNSCTVQVNGAGTADATVALPVVDTSALDDSSAAHDTAGGTFFDITVNGCEVSQTDLDGSAPAQVAVYLEAGPTVDPATNGLINAGTSNVQVSLYSASASHVVGSQITPGSGGTGQPASQPVADTTTQYFYAAYSLPEGEAPTAGTVTTTVTYSLVYN